MDADNVDHWDNYLWMVVMGAIAAFGFAWALGANNVADAWGTAVGAKTLTLWEACLLAVFLEAGGAVALGGQITKTIAGGIARPEAFENDPELFAYGMLCSSAAATLWITFATYLGLAVSTTHTIIGAVVGMALAWQGGSAVVWNDATDTFPYRAGILPIVLSWVIAPFMACIMAWGLFSLNRMLVLRKENSSEKALYALPVLIIVTVFVNVFFVLLRGAGSELNWPTLKSAWVAAATAGGACLLAAGLGMPLLRWKINRDVNKGASHMEIKLEKDIEGDEEDGDGQKNEGMRLVLKSVLDTITHGVTQDVHDQLHEDQQAVAMHQAAEIFDPKTELVYKHLQIFSSSCLSFAHGAKDVGNAVGPFVGIWYVYNHFSVSSQALTPRWVLVLGGLGISLGCCMYGYNVMRALGVRLAKMSASRGLCSDVSTALTISLAVICGLPISTTHCAVGAEVGVGLAESMRTGINRSLLLKLVAGWICTLIVSGLASAALFAQGAYAPSIIGNRDLMAYEAVVRNLAEMSYLSLNDSNYRHAEITGRFNATLDQSIMHGLENLQVLFNRSATGHVFPSEVQYYLQRSLSLYHENSMITVGYNASGAIITPQDLVVPAPT